MSKTELLAVYDFERYRFNNEEGDHLIADAFDEDGKLVTVKGDEISSGFKRGISYRFFGRWTTYRDQKQFAFTSAVQCAPFGRKGVVKYLQLAHKLGKATAENIWDAYGSESLKMIREGDEDEFLEATGVRRELFLEWRAYFLRHHAMESCVVDLTNILDGQGLPKKIIGHCIDMWGVQAAEVVKQNPYKLMQFRGVGFSRCDRMFLSFGHRPDSLRRQALCAWHGIAQRHQDGHTWVPEAIAQSTLRGMIGGATVNEEKALRLALRGGLLESMYTENGELHWFGDTRWLADKQKSKAERRLARCIVEALREEPRAEFNWRVHGLSDHQACVYSILRSQRGCIRILGGGPGTGKTHTLAAVVKSILPEVGQDKIAIAAPTGKAAVRITEGLAGHGIPVRATTIHSLLGFSPSGFRYGSDNPLPQSLIIIDESSMLDTGLCNSLMQARGRNTAMLFIGDVNQLPPVGHGAPLRDMIASGLVPYGELTEVRRNSGEIVRQCENIRDNGTMLVRSSDDPRYDDENIELVHGSDDKSKIRAMLNLLTLDRKPDANPIWDYQVLVPTNKSGDLGRKALNKVLQSRLNRHKPVPASPFRLRDKVVCLKNGFFRCLEADDLAPRNQNGDVYVANGDIGEVIECEPARMVIKLTSPYRVIATGRSTKQREDVREDDMDAMLKTEEDTGTGCSFDLAYALSVHKAQGSESPYVIVMLDDSGGAARICSREWIYTAISRAKKHCYLVGSLQTAEGMCRVQKVGERKTFLAEQIHRVMETEPEEVEASIPLPAVSSIEQEFSEL